MSQRETEQIKKDQRIEKVRLALEIDLKELELIIFLQGRVTDHRINLTLHKLEEFLEGEAFDEIIESLSLKSTRGKFEQTLNYGYTECIKKRTINFNR